MIDMLHAARSVRKQTGESLETIVTKAVTLAVRDRFDNHEISQFMDILDEVTEELVGQFMNRQLGFQEMKTINPCNGTSNER